MVNPREATVSKFYERILLATEGTEFDVGAERLAIDLAVACNLPLRAVRPVVSNPVFTTVAPVLAAKAEAEAVTYLDELRQRARAQGVDLQGSVRVGERPEEQIVAEASERNADLIVLRRRGKRSYVANLLIGAMVHMVVGHAPCDVLVVPRAARMWSRRVLLATDGSTNSDRATEAAAVVAARRALPAAVVSVLASDQQDESVATANIERALAVFRAAGVPATGRTASGKPYEAILAVGRDVGADLIVVGRRGIGGAERLLLGSTSERVSGYADCPVLIARA
jgi:nucleotide-binding universal stress UspA family protein